MLIKLEHESCMPTRSNPTDAGLDLRCKLTTTLQYGVRTLVPTGVSEKIPIGQVGLLFPRISLSKQGITMTNSVGVIDSDYRGEIMASLMFNGAPGNCNETYLPGGERIVQLVVVPISLPDVTVVDWPDEEWNDTQRGTGGFGSTGKA